MWQREVAGLQDCRGPSVLALRESSFDSTNTFAIVEAARFGDLFDYRETYEFDMRDVAGVGL